MYKGTVNYELVVLYKDWIKFNEFDYKICIKILSILEVVIWSLSFIKGVLICNVYTVISVDRL